MGDRNEQLREEGLSLLAGSLSNDLNNKLAAIAGTADLELKKNSKHDWDISPFEVIRDLSMNASKLTNQLQTYAGQGCLHRQRVDMNGIVADTLREIRPKVPRFVGLDVKLAKPPVLTLDDPGALKRVVSNLLENAVEAINGRIGTIVMETSLRFLDATGQAGVAPTRPSITVRVGNDGPGIARDKLHRIFDPYYTIKQPGLGLASVQGIVRAHNGSVSVKSDEEQGTVFEVCLPATSTRNLGSNSSDTTGFSGKCLIVDDEVTVLKVLNGVMTYLGFECVEPINGLDALNCVRSGQHNFSCAVIDICMPGMDGRETALEIRKVDPHLPIVSSTGFASSNIPRDLLELERTIIVKKPYTIRQMADGVSKLLT